MSSVLYCGGYQVLRGFLSPVVGCLVWKESPWPVRDCGQGGREDGSMGGWAGEGGLSAGRGGLSVGYALYSNGHVRRIRQIVLL